MEGRSVEAGDDLVDVDRAGGAKLLGAILVEQDDQEIAGLDMEAVAHVGHFAGGDERQVLEGTLLAGCRGGGDGNDDGVADGKFEAVALDELQLPLEFG